MLPLKNYSVGTLDVVFSLHPLLPTTTAWKTRKMRAFLRPRTRPTKQPYSPVGQGPCRTSSHPCRTTLWLHLAWPAPSPCTSALFSNIRGSIKDCQTGHRGTGPRGRSFFIFESANILISRKTISQLLYFFFAETSRVLSVVAQTLVSSYWRTMSSVIADIAVMWAALAPSHSRLHGQHEPRARVSVWVRAASRHTLTNLLPH